MEHFAVLPLKDFVLKRILLEDSWGPGGFRELFGGMVARTELVTSLHLANDLERH